MTTIEERAKSILRQYTKQPTAIDLYSKNEVLKMLVKIATEQKKIDEANFADASKNVIDKACEWLDDNAINYIEKYGITNWKSLKDDFRKAMEE